MVDVWLPVFFNTGFMVLRPNITVRPGGVIAVLDFAAAREYSHRVWQLYDELVAAAPYLPSEEAEQSALNEYFHGRWQQLPYVFNFQKHTGTSPTRLQL